MYSNSAKACEENAIERIESKLGVVPKEHLEGKVIFTLTGKLGIMRKSFLAEAFAGEDNNDTLPTNFVCHTPMQHSAVYPATNATSAFDTD